MKISKERAEETLREAFDSKEQSAAIDRCAAEVERLSVACEGSAKTHIAFLGTALLAKAVDLSVDVFAVKSVSLDKGAQAGAYSARVLSHTVLVPFATEFGVDLGVSGREPLNNQPYFRMNRVDDNTPVLGSSKAALAVLKQILTNLDAVSTRQEARAALIAFIRRRRKAASLSGTFVPGTLLTVADLTEVIESFTSESEGGKRPQAVVAGLLDVFAGDGRVDAGRINDPSRHYPGDVVIYSEEYPDQIEKAFEVRDKPVSESDVLIFGNAALKYEVREAAVVAVSPKQAVLDEDRIAKWAAQRGMSITLFTDWEDLIEQTLFWSPPQGPRAAVEAATAINRRLIEVEVSKRGLQMWDELLSKYRPSGA